MFIDYKSSQTSQAIYFVVCAERYQLAAEECLKSLVSLRESAVGEKNDLFSKLNDSKKLVLHFSEEENRFCICIFILFFSNFSSTIGWFSFTHSLICKYAKILWKNEQVKICPPILKRM